jgi:hypothetical protein
MITMDPETCAKLNMTLEGFGMPSDELRASAPVGNGETTG